MPKTKGSGSKVPPVAVQKAAARALKWRREHNRGGTEVGVARARDLSNGKGIPMATIKRMNSYFARHAVDLKAKGARQGQAGYPSAGRVAWDLWGGDAGRRWAVAMLKQEKQRKS